MKTSNKMIRILVMAAILFGINLNTAKTPVEAKPAKQPAVVRVGILTGLSSSVLQIAAKKGFLKTEFAKEGVKVEEKWFIGLGGPAIIEAMETNNVDIGGMADQPLIQAVANGNSVRIISTMSQSDKYVNLVVPKNSPAKSIKDLKGKKIGAQVGTIGHRVLYLLLEANGMKKDDVIHVNLKGTEILASFASGAVDGFITSEPTTSKLELDGEVKEIGNTQGIQTNYAILVATGEFRKQYPQQVKTFLRAIRKSVAYINEPANYNDVVKTLAETSKVEPEVIKKALAKFDFAIEVTDATRKSFRDSIADLYANRTIRKNLTVDELLDTRFLIALGYQKK